MSRFCLLALPAWGLGVVLLAAGSSAAQPPNPLLDRVRADWDARSQAAQSLRITWTMKNTTPAGAITTMLGKKGKSGEAVPTADATHEGNTLLLINGLDARVESTRFVWDHSIERFTRKSDRTVFRDGRSLTVHRNDYQKWDTAAAVKSNWATAREITTWPVLVMFRGTSKEVLNREDLSIFTTARQVAHDGRQLVELVRERDETSGEVIVRVDPARASIPLQYESYDTDGSLVRRISISPKRDGTGLWAPSSWSVAVYIDKKLVRYATATVTELVIAPPVSPDDFRLDLEAGTDLFDMTGKEQNEYIVKEDGTHREVLPGEVHASHEDLMRTESGDLLPGGRPWFVSRYRTPIAITGLVCVAAAVIALAIRRRRSKVSTTGSQGPTT